MNEAGAVKLVFALMAAMSIWAFDEDAGAAKVTAAAVPEPKVTCVEAVTIGVVVLAPVT